MFKENPEVFLDDFGIDCVFTLRQTAETRRVRAIFDAAEMDGNAGRVAAIATVQPRLSLPLVSVTGLARGDDVECSDAVVFPNGKAKFRVLEIINEGTGWAIIPLAKA